MYNRHYVVPLFAALFIYLTIESIYNILGGLCVFHVNFTDILGFRSSILIIATKPTNSTSTIIINILPADAYLQVMSLIRCDNCGKMLNSANKAKLSQDQIHMIRTKNHQIHFKARLLL